MCNRSACLCSGPGRLGSVFICCDFRYQKTYVFFPQILAWEAQSWKWRCTVLRVSADRRKLAGQLLFYPCSSFLQTHPLAPSVCPSREWGYQLSHSHFLQTKMLISAGVFSQENLPLFPEMLAVLATWALYGQRFLLCWLPLPQKGALQIPNSVTQLRLGIMILTPVWGSVTLLYV